MYVTRQFSLDQLVPLNQIVSLVLVIVHVLVTVHLLRAATQPFDREQLSLFSNEVHCFHQIREYPRVHVPGSVPATCGPEGFVDSHGAVSPEALHPCCRNLPSLTRS